MNFRVGQKVIRVAVDRSIATGTCRPPSAQLTEVGKIYTIRTIHVWPSKTLLCFHELDNSHLIGFDGNHIEPGFNSLGFRPLVVRKTSIEIFTRMLRPVPEKVRV